MSSKFAFIIKINNSNYIGFENAKCAAGKNLKICVMENKNHDNLTALF